MEKIEQILEMGKANREEIAEDFEECFQHGKKALHLYSTLKQLHRFLTTYFLSLAT